MYDVKLIILSLETAKWYETLLTSPICREQVRTTKSDRAVATGDSQSNEIYLL